MVPRRMKLPLHFLRFPTPVADAALPPAVGTTENKTTSDETAETGSAVVDFVRDWELYSKGEIGARGILAVLVRIHGEEELRACWPRVLADLPTDEVSEVLESFNFIVVFHRVPQRAVFCTAFSLDYTRYTISRMVYIDNNC